MNIENQSVEEKLALIPEYIKEISRLQKANAKLVVKHESEKQKLVAQHESDIERLKAEHFKTIADRFGPPKQKPPA